MTGNRRRFGPQDVVIGDYAWGVGAWLPHPVIRVNHQSITVGIHRDTGRWLTTQTLRWDEIRGVIPAVSAPPADLAQALTAAADRVRQGFLDRWQRDALAALLQIAAGFTLPTPVTATLFTAVTTLTRPPREEEAGS